MSRYDGLIIPRSYSEYINKTDAATLQQALQLSGVLSGAVAAGDNKAVTSNAVNNALKNYDEQIYEKPITVGKGISADNEYVYDFSRLTKNKIYIVSFCGTFSEQYSFYGILFNGSGSVRLKVIEKSSFINDPILSLLEKTLTFSWNNNPVQIGTDSAIFKVVRNGK